MEGMHRRKMKRGYAVGKRRKEIEWKQWNEGEKKKRHEGKEEQIERESEELEKR